MVQEFPHQALDFFGAIRARMYDDVVMDMIEREGGSDNIAKILARPRRTRALGAPSKPREQDEERIRRKREALKKYKLSEINAEDLMSLQQEGVFDNDNDDGITFILHITMALIKNHSKQTTLRVVPTRRRDAGPAQDRAHQPD